MRNPVSRIPFLALLGLAFIATAAHAATLKETFQQTYPLQASREVSLDNVNGAVKIEGWDRNEVQVVAEKQVKAGNAEDARKAMDQIKIIVGKTAGGLSIETKLPKREGGFFDWLSGNNININVTYRVRVPRSVALDVETVNGGVTLSGTRGKTSLETTNGAIDVARVGGNIRLRSTNGGLVVADSTGTVDASTTNGGIEVDLKDVPDVSDLSFSTTNGSVTLRLPRDVRVSLDAATSNGRVSTSFEVDGDGGKPNRRHLSGDINGGGGGKLHIRSTNGSVDIESQ